MTVSSFGEVEDDERWLESSAGIGGALCFVRALRAEGAVSLRISSSGLDVDLPGTLEPVSFLGAEFLVWNRCL